MGEALFDPIMFLNKVPLKREGEKVLLMLISTHNRAQTALFVGVLFHPLSTQSDVVAT